MFCSGQIAIDPSTNTLVDGGIKEQTKQVLNNLHAILSESGVTFGNVVRVEIYLVDMNDFEEVNNLYGEVFNKEPLPARVTVGVASLPKGALVEMSCITVI
jgi:2-iminobutanoate/2-iminopropanoate deaminase